MPSLSDKLRWHQLPLFIFDRSCKITAEIVDITYEKILKSQFLDDLGCTSVHVVCIASQRSRHKTARFCFMRESPARVAINGREWSDLCGKPAIALCSGSPAYLFQVKVTEAWRPCPRHVRAKQSAMFKPFENKHTKGPPQVDLDHNKVKANIPYT